VRERECAPYKRWMKPSETPGSSLRNADARGLSPKARTARDGLKPQTHSPSNEIERDARQIHDDFFPTCRVDVSGTGNRRQVTRRKAWPSPPPSGRCFADRRYSVRDCRHESRRSAAPAPRGRSEQRVLPAAKAQRVGDLREGSVFPVSAGVWREATTGPDSSVAEFMNRGDCWKGGVLARSISAKPLRLAPLVFMGAGMASAARPNADDDPGKCVTDRPSAAAADTATHFTPHGCSKHSKSDGKDEAPAGQLRVNGPRPSCRPDPMHVVHMLRQAPRSRSTDRHGPQVRAFRIHKGGLQRPPPQCRPAGLPGNRCRQCARPLVDQGKTAAKTAGSRWESENRCDDERSNASWAVLHPAAAARSQRLGPPLGQQLGVSSVTGANTRDFGPIVRNRAD